MTATFGGVTIDVDPVGFVFGDYDRLRSSPTDNPPALTQAKIYQDVVYAPGDSTPSDKGFDINLSGLTANKYYDFTIWSYDSASIGTTRYSDWQVEDANGTQMAREAYSFIGSTLPATNAAQAFTFSGRANASGTLKITGRGNDSLGTSVSQVFINGLQASEVQNMSGALVRYTFAGGTYTNKGNAPATIYDISGNDKNATTVAATSTHIEVVLDAERGGRAFVTQCGNGGGCRNDFEQLHVCKLVQGDRYRRVSLRSAGHALHPRIRRSRSNCRSASQSRNRCLRHRHHRSFRRQLEPHCLGF